MCIWVYGHVLVAWLGVRVSSTYRILLMMKKRSHTLSIAPLLMAFMCAEEMPRLRVSTTTVDKICINHSKGKSTKYLWVLVVPSRRNPKNHNRHICSCSGQRSFSLRITAILLQFMRSKYKMASGIWKLATVDPLGSHGITVGF